MQSPTDASGIRRGSQLPSKNRVVARRRVPGRAAGVLEEAVHPRVARNAAQADVPADATKWRDATPEAHLSADSVLWARRGSRPSFPESKGSRPAHQAREHHLATVRPFHPARKGATRTSAVPFGARRAVRRLRLTLRFCRVFRLQLIQLNVNESGLHGLEWKTRDPYSFVNNSLITRTHSMARRQRMIGSDKRSQQVTAVHSCSQHRI